jgi:hypothetical protein
MDDFAVGQLFSKNFMTSTGQHAVWLVCVSKMKDLQVRMSLLLFTRTEGRPWQKASWCRKSKYFPRLERR